MVLRFGQTRGDDVAALIAKKQYARRSRSSRSSSRPSAQTPALRIQLGDLLVLAGKTKEAVAILSPLADEFAREGFAAKAIAILKKIQKLDPSQHDVEARLAILIQEKTHGAWSSRSGVPVRAQEIGLEALDEGAEPEPSWRSASSRRRSPRRWRCRRRPPCACPCPPRHPRP